MHILLVEDHEDSAKVLRILFETKGYQVTTARTVALALHAASERSFDLLISDISLPDGSGHDLLQALIGRGAPPPAIAISAHCRPEDIAASLGVGFHSHLKKPIDIRLLSETIAMLAGAPMREAGASAIVPLPQPDLPPIP